MVKHALGVRLSKVSILFAFGRRRAGIKLFSFENLSLGI